MKFRTFTSAVAALVVFGCATPTQLILDAEVDRLCAVDGGIKVYEKKRLPASRFDRFGAVTVPLKQFARATDDFFYTWDSVELKGQGKEGRLSRSHFRLYETRGERLLGEAVAYSRIGGDVPGPWHASSYGCPENTDISNLERQVFLRSEGEGKQ